MTRPEWWGRKEGILPRDLPENLAQAVVSPEHVLEKGLAEPARFDGVNYEELRTALLLREAGRLRLTVQRPGQ
jgi:hypothetical protein